MTDTVPYSLLTTVDTSDKNIVEVTLVASGDGFTMDYPGGAKRIYSYAVDGDGVIHTGTNSKNVADRHTFWYDAENKQIYQNHNGVRYVLCAMLIKNLNSGEEQIRMKTVPVSEVGEANGVYPVRFTQKHACTFGDDWASDEFSHWHPCFCGEKSGIALHAVDAWTTTKEPAVGVEGSKSGKCTVCGADVTETIPALTDDSTQPTQDSQTPGTSEPVTDNEQNQSNGTIDPIGLAAVIVLAVTGLAVMIWGKKKDKA